jgi:NADH-quinone oxidoreductase subunit H
MLNVSAVATTLFFGGWRAPWPISAINDGMFNTGWWPVLWFLAKLWFFMFLFVWIRGTLLRFRYDQFMKFGWKILIPAALVWILFKSVQQGFFEFGHIERKTVFVVAGIALVLAALSFLIPERKPPAEREAPPKPFDAFAGGYPVPPLPGETLPPSPRRLRAERYAQELSRTAVLEAAPTSTTDEQADGQEETPRG